MNGIPFQAVQFITKKRITQNLHKATY